jgi:hypothetical protein
MGNIIGKMKKKWEIDNNNRKIDIKMGTYTR